MKRLLLILAVVVAQLLAGPAERAVASHAAGRPTVSREENDAGRLERQVAAARHSAVRIVRSRARTRVQRVTSMASVAPTPTARFAAIVAHRPTTEGTVNPERFLALGLPDTRAP